MYGSGYSGTPITDAVIAAYTIKARERESARQATLNALAALNNMGYDFSDLPQPQFNQFAARVEQATDGRVSFPRDEAGNYVRPPKKLSKLIEERIRKDPALLESAAAQAVGGVTEAMRFRETQAGERLEKQLQAQREVATGRAKAQKELQEERLRAQKEMQDERLRVQKELARKARELREQLQKMDVESRETIARVNAAAKADPRAKMAADALVAFSGLPTEARKAMLPWYNTYVFNPQGFELYTEEHKLWPDAWGVRPLQQPPQPQTPPSSPPSADASVEELLNRARKVTGR